jgi:hypothetical protein
LWGHRVVHLTTYPLLVLHSKHSFSHTLQKKIWLAINIAYATLVILQKKNWLAICTLHTNFIWESNAQGPWLIAWPGLRWCHILKGES